MGPRRLCGQLDSELRIYSASEQFIGNGAGWGSSSADELFVSTAADVRRVIDVVSTLCPASARYGRPSRSFRTVPPAGISVCRSRCPLLVNLDPAAAAAVPIGVSRQVHAVIVPGSVLCVRNHLMVCSPGAGDS